MSSNKASACNGVHMRLVLQELVPDGGIWRRAGGIRFTGSKYSTPVNFSGWFVQASYFLTGEELTRRVNVVQPRRDFNFDASSGGEFSPGAVELHARYSTMDLGRNIFTAGFADPDL